MVDLISEIPYRCYFYFFFQLITHSVKSLDTVLSSSIDLFLNAFAMSVGSWTWTLNLFGSFFFLAALISFSPFLSVRLAN